MQALGRKYRRSFSLGALAFLCSGACRTAPVPRDPHPSGGQEAVSLTGEPLVSPPLALATRQAYEQQLAEATRAYERSPMNADSIIWLGRRTAYLGRYRDAISMERSQTWAEPLDSRAGNPTRSSRTESPTR